ncbi:MAG: hypothetical protein QNJ90_15380 [Planctomycetota bacterium]|nr:hypothetical protein [Planctomycetota bacterium]
MPASFPTEFRCSFLRSVAEAFLRRRKAIAHNRSFEWESADDDEGERLSLWIIGHAERPTLALHLWDGNLARLFLRSCRSSERGKVLLRLDDMVLVDDAPAIVEAFEHTMSLCHWFHEHGTADEIRATWRDLVVTGEL